MNENANIAVVYHSGYGHTEVIANAVARGAEESGADAALIKVAQDGTISDNGWKLLESADAIIFGAPTYMGSASGPFKTFMDATSKPWFAQKWKDKLAGGFTVSGNLSGDKLSTLQQFTVLAAQHSMVWISQGVMAANTTADAPHQRGEEEVNRLGSFLGVMAQAENLGADITPPKGDVKSAELYGARVAAAAKRWNK
jgi:NAD(P)H dehydrogenase (quinone)